MNKPLPKNNIQTTPYAASKDWQLSNLFNDNLILTEHSGSPIALEYLEYSTASVKINRLCNIALEQQDYDRVLLRDGKKSSGIFYPDEEDINSDGTFKRLVYSQIKTTFYNNYRDPTKIWGLENIDFENSKTKRFLSDEFQLYDIPTNVFGEKLVENTLNITNTNQDNNYTITDDGRGNLFARTNLFAKQQEVGYFINDFIDDDSDVCNTYFSLTEPSTVVLSAVQDEYTASLSWTMASGVVDGYILERSINSGSTYTQIASLDSSTLTFDDGPLLEEQIYFYRVYAFNDIGNSDYSNVVEFQLSFFDSITDLTGSFSVSINSILFGTASLTWSSGSKYATELLVHKTTQNTYPSYSIIASIPSSSTFYIDSSLIIGDTYIYRLETTNSVSSSYSNEVSVSFEGAVDTFENYNVGQTSIFNKGTGSWADRWRLWKTLGIQAYDIMSDYDAGQTASFDGGDGWTNNWTVITASIHTLVAYDTMQSYINGQTSSFSGGIGWSNNWIDVTASIHTLVAYDTMQSYLDGQTSSFDGGFGWINNWNI